MGSGVVLKLILGVKRLRFRANDARSGKADAEFKAKRKPALMRQGYRCAGCGYKSSEKFSHLDIHHADDDHHNNEDANLLVACHTCHPYQHVGELVRRTDIPAEGLGGRTKIVSVPEVSAADLNLLQRAIGAALHNPDEAVYAAKMLEVLESRQLDVKADFGTAAPADFAGAMFNLSQQEYEHRADAIEDLRIVFNKEVLKIIGTEFLLDNPSMPVDRWASVAKSVESRKVSDRRS